MHDATWNQVEAALDARRSPFDDPELAERLRADPESERAVRRLLEGLARLEGARPARRGRRRIAVAAAVLVVAAGGWLARSEVLGRERPEPARGEFTVVFELTEPAAPRCARVELAPRRILAWRLEGETR